jgi:hypothetical protein
MDRIEPADDSNGRPDPQPASELHPMRPTSYARNRTLSNSRRPSIRIQRRPSASSVENSNPPPSEQPPSDEDRRSVGALKALDIAYEEEWPGNRRRSSSEPRPGRWSAPNPVVLSRVATRSYRSPMHSVNEEPPNQTPLASSPSQGTDAHLLAPPPAAPAGNPRNILRRTSEAAMNTFSRSRASTVSGAPPEPDPSNEYGPRVVDVLDVIGKAACLT